MFNIYTSKAGRSGWFRVTMKSSTAIVPTDKKGLKGIIDQLKHLDRRGALDEYTITIKYIDDWEVAERREYERLKERYGDAPN